MRRKYLIKKDPAIEAKDNWLVMTYRQYKAWLNTPEGKSRELTLGVLKGCCDGDVEYHIECDEQTAKKWKKDQNHSDYLRQIWFESGYELISYNVSPVIDDEEMTGEELLEDDTCDVAEEVMMKCMKEELRMALKELDADEMAVIYNEYYAEDKRSEEAMAKLLEKTRDQIRYLKKTSLQKLRSILGANS